MIRRFAYSVGALFFLFASARGEEPSRPAERSEIFKSLSKNLAQGKPIELEALEIRARIYEPQVIYILDRTKVDVEFHEEDVHFSSRIVDPILENHF